MSRQYFTHAIRDAIAEAMRDDETVYVFGEDIDKSVLGATQGLFDEFGEHRVRNTPISEQAVIGSLIGAALTGMRPVFDVMFGSFFYVAMDQLINQAAHIRYMSGGQVSIPLVFIAGVGPSGQAGSQHSESPHAILMGAAGLKVVAPSSPADAKGLMTAALADPDPVMFMMDISLAGTRGEVPEGHHHVPIGRAEVKRVGGDVTVVAMLSAVPAALEAAARLAEQGIEVEVVDVRSLVPLDIETILESVRKTGQLIVVEQGRRTCGFASEVSTLVTEHAWDALRSAPVRITWPDVPVPYSPSLELACIVSADQIVAQVESMLAQANVGRG